MPKRRRTPNVFDYMWENYFKRRYKVIPKNRRAKTVTALRKLIIEMYTAGYAFAAIGNYLKKNHPTIMHHVRAAGYETRGAKRTIGLSPEVLRQCLDAKRDRIAELEEKRKIRLAHERKLEQMRKQRTAEIKALRMMCSPWTNRADHTKQYRGTFLFPKIGFRRS